MRTTAPHDETATWSGRNHLLRIRMVSSADDRHRAKDVFVLLWYRTRAGSVSSRTSGPTGMAELAHLWPSVSLLFYKNLNFSIRTPLTISLPSVATLKELHIHASLTAFVIIWGPVVAPRG